MDDWRRRICQVGGGLILAGAILPAAGGCLGSAKSNSDGAADLVFAGTVDQLPVGMILFVSSGDHNLNVCRDAGGFYALSANCTHANCLVLFQAPANPTGFSCPCHSSTFDYNGGNPTGPATTTGPLPHFKVTLAGNQIYVDPTIKVDAVTRAT